MVKHKFNKKKKKLFFRDFFDKKIILIIKLTFTSVKIFENIIFPKIKSGFSILNSGMKLFYLGRLPKGF